MNDKVFEKISVYIACLFLIGMGWQAWRDMNKDLSALAERIAKLEMKMHCEEKR